RHDLLAHLFCGPTFLTWRPEGSRSVEELGMRNFTQPIFPAWMLGLVVALTAGVAFAQTKPAADQRGQEILLLKSEIKRLEQRVESLEGVAATVKTIDRKVDAQDQKLQVQEAAAQKKEATAPIVKVGADGFSLSSADHANNINFNGVVQGDSRFFTSGNDKNVSSTFYLNKARLIFTGALAKYYIFNITPDFGQGNVVLQDAYLNMAHFEVAELRTGKYKSPFDLERLQIDRDIEYS